MYLASGGFHSHTSSPFHKHHQGIIWGAHASDCSSDRSTSLPSSKETQTQSQGPCGGYGQEQTHDFECVTPENSPRGGYHPDCLLQDGSQIPRSHDSARSWGAAPMVMTTPMTGYYTQMPVVFMRISNIASYQEKTASQTETTPSSSANSIHENSGEEEEPMWGQTAHDLPKPRLPAFTRASSKVSAGLTTLVIRNVPARYTPDMLLQEIGPDGSFDFFFLPYTFRASKTMGVAFINFRSPDLALCFQERWHRRFLQNHGHTKHLDISAATYQGIVENLKQFNHRNIARLERAGRLPVFLDGLGNHLNSVRELKRYGVLPAAW